MFLDWDADGFRRQFTQGLVEMLQRDAPGAWILVLANSMQDPQFRAALPNQLRKPLIASGKRRPGQARTTLLSSTVFAKVLRTSCCVTGIQPRRMAGES